MSIVGRAKYHPLLGRTRKGDQQVQRKSKHLANVYMYVSTCYMSC